MKRLTKSASFPPQLMKKEVSYRAKTCVNILKENGLLLLHGVLHMLATTDPVIQNC